MTTSTSPVRTPSTSTGPLRIVLAAPRRNRRLDGGWWPHSRDLAVELAQLLAGLPEETGRAVRAVYSPPDWDTPPRRVPLASGYLKVGSFPRDDSHLLDLRMLNGTTLRLLVVPPTADPQRARTALDAAAAEGDTGTVATILSAMDPPSEEQPDQPSDDPDTTPDRPDNPEENR